MKGQSVTGVCSAVVTSAAVRWQRWFLPLCLCASLGININNRAASSFFIFSHQVFIAHVQQNSGFPNDRYRLPTAISSRNSSGKSIVLFWIFKKKREFFFLLVRKGVEFDMGGGFSWICIWISFYGVEKLIRHRQTKFSRYSPCMMNQYFKKCIFFPILFR